MVDRYNLSVSNQGIQPAEMRAVCAELRGRDEELEELGGLKFDVITVCVKLTNYWRRPDN